MKYFWIFLFTVLSVSASTQTADTSRLNDLQFSILTCGSGEQLYELFGHSALRVHQPSRGIDHVFNWGVGDFYSPGFALRFLKGKLNYYLAVSTMDQFLRDYNIHERSVDEQLLNLNAKEKAEILAFINNNNRSGNRGFQYDFFYDNCTTRIRDILNKFAPELEYGDIAQEDITLRELIHSHLDSYNWTEFGMDLVLGATNDVIADEQVQMFLPIYLYEYAEQATTAGKPLLKGQERLLAFPSTPSGNFTISPHMLFWGIFTLEILLFFLFYVSGNQGPLYWMDRLWFGVMTICAIIFVFMWFFTDHAVCKYNYNLIWTVPWTIFAFSSQKKRNSLIFLLTIISCLILLLGWTLLPQYIHTAIIPVALTSILKSLRHLGLVKWIDGAKPSLLAVGLFFICLQANGQNRIAGITVVAPPSEYQSDPMQKVAKVNANWVALVPYGFSRKGDPEVRWGSNRQWWGERKEGITSSVNLSHKNKLKVMLKPQVWIHNSWVGDVDFENEEDWQIWENSYRAYIMSFVDMAIDLDIEMICIGTEYRIAVKKREAFWRQLIKDVRARYDGLITYSANWDSYENVPIWDALDYVGISGYFPLSEMDTPPVLLLTYRWNKPIKKLRKFSDKVGKQILFTEYGYLSVDGAAGKTWELEKNVKSRDINEQAQANGYEAFFKALSREDFWAGGFLWKWFPEGKGHEGYPERDYTPQGKKAEKVITQWHERITTSK